MDANDETLAALKTRYEELRSSKTGYDPFRFCLDYRYEQACEEVLNTPPEQRTEELKNRLLAVLDGAARGEDADAIVWEFRGYYHKVHQDSRPILLAVPKEIPSAQKNGDLTTEAALECAFPGKWTYNSITTSFGAFVTGICWGHDEDVGEHHTTFGTGGGGSYGFFFHNGLFSNVGVSGYRVYDGDVMGWSTGTANDSMWYHAMLRYYFGFGDGEVEAALQKRGLTLDDVIYLSTQEEVEKLFKDEDLDNNGNKLDDFRRYGFFRETTEGEKVVRLIAAIGDVGPRSGPAIQEARAAYENLKNPEDRKLVETQIIKQTTDDDGNITEYTALEVLKQAEEAFKAFQNSGSGTTSTAWSSALGDVMTKFQNTTPAFGTTKGEWMVLAVARYNLSLATGTDENPSYADKYLSALNSELRRKGLEGLDLTGNQHTEYSRVVLALTALGENAEDYVDPTDGAHYNFISKLQETDKVISQGINGPIFALLALDSKPYLPDDKASNTGSVRWTYIGEILGRQLNYGGWSYDGTTADTDMTAMAIQALAPYYSQDLKVQKAINLGLEVLAGKQSPEGGFYSNGTYNSESCSQVIVALTALAHHTGSGTLTGDKWSICSTEFRNPVNALMSFYKDGMFGHALGDRDQMATEQAAYALVAYNRYDTNDYPLYTMLDASKSGGGDTGNDLAAVKRAQAAVYADFEGKLDWLVSGKSNDAIKTEIEQRLSKLSLGGVETAVTIHKNTSPEAGTANNPNGIDGEVSFSVALSKGSVTLFASFNKSFPAAKYASNDSGLRSVAMLGKAGKFQENDPYTIVVTLEKEKAEQGLQITDGDFQITPRDSGAKVIDLKRQSFSTWTFCIQAEDKTVSRDYTIEVVMSDVPQEIAQANVDAAASIVEAANNETLPADTQTESDIIDWAESLVPDTVGITKKVETKITVPAVNGTKDKPNGVDGEATITVTLTTDYQADLEQSAGIEDGSQELLDEAWAKINAAKALVGQVLGSAELSSDTDTLQEWASTQLRAIADWDADVSFEIAVEIVPPVAGTEETPTGIPGKASFIVTLSSMAGETEVKDTQTVDRELPAASYVPLVESGTNEDQEALIAAAQEKINTAKALVVQVLSVPAELPADTDALQEWASTQVEAIPDWDSDVSAEIVVTVTAPTDGTEENTQGTPGKAVFTVTLSCMAGETEVKDDTLTVEQELSAVPYTPEQETDPNADIQVLSFLYNDGPEGVKSITETVTITVKIPAKPYVASNNTKLASVVYNDQELKPDGRNYKLELPTGKTFQTAWLVITPIDPDASVSDLSSEGNGVWNFTVTAANEKDIETYSLLVTSVSGTIDENRNAVNAAWSKINAIDSWAVPMETVNNSESGVKTYINTRIAGLVGSVSYSIAIDDFEKAVEGSKETPKGTDGSFTATITLSKGIPASSTYVEESVTIEGTITAKEYEAKPEGEITVWFTLLGDTDHGDPGTTNTHTLADRNLDTWIPTQELTVPAGSTVGYVFSMVLDEWGYSYVGLEGNYIKTIITPRGLRLSEFTNGKLSGWMYTVNGEHPNQGLNKWTLNDKDEIIWHYTDDYTKERGGTGNSNANGSAELTPTAIVRNGTASAAVTEEELNAAVDAAIKDRLSTILIAPVGTERADSLSVDLPTTSLYDAARNGIGVTVESTTGSVVVPGDALSGIVRTARGSDVTITTSVLNSYEAERLLEGEELEEEQLTSSSVTEVTISSGRTAITSWGGRSITLSLPVDSRNFEARERYTVYQISENGSIEEHTGRCVRSGGALFVEVDVTHLSTFVVVPTTAETADEEKAPEALPTNVYLPFVDTANHWALDSIGYVYQKGLMSGTGAYNFQPNISMSRAMFVTVLHRLEGTPASTGVNVYSDVVPNGWYTDAVTWATSAGIVNGTGEGKFSPNASISREEMATMMMRYAKYKSYDTAATTDLAGYADANQIHDWAYRAMEWANSTGMITGRTAFTLVPQGTATRAETATILVRFIQKFMPSKY